MKETIQESYFIDRFREMNREENFSYEGRKALFRYLEQYEEDTGEEIEMDIIALCCEYTEYRSLEEFQEEYNKEDYPDLETLSEYTTVIEINDSAFIIKAF